MISRLSCAFVLLLYSPISVAAENTAGTKARLTPQQAISERRLRDLRWSANGGWLAFTVSDSPKGTESHQHIWAFSAASRELRQFTHSRKSESHPRWSPDGKQLAFLSDREEFQQIFIMPTNGGEAVPLTEGKRAIGDFQWSPNGKQIAFLAPEPKTEAEEKKENEKDDAKSADRDEKRAHLWLVDVDSRKARQLVGTPWHCSELQWSPRGDRLFVIATDHPESDQETNRIYSVSLSEGGMQEISGPRGPLERLRISPDGKWISYLAARTEGPVPHDLFIQASQRGAPARNLTAHTLDRPIAQYTWRADGKILLIFHDGFRREFATVATDGSAERLPLQRATAGDSILEPVADEFDLAPSGIIAFSGQNTTRLPELWIQEKKAAAQSISHFNQSFDSFALAAMEFVHYKSFDGREIEGALLLPPNSDAKSKLPTVILVHGGPTGNWSDQFEPWGQLLANAGYAVLYPNVRGSTGYGYDFMVLNRGDWGGGDFKDVMAGVDYLVARGTADSERLGIAGWSYGGYMAEWAITQTQRFKAAVTGAGISDLAAEFGTETHPSYDEWFYGLPYEKLEGFRRSSPLSYIKSARTPTLILQGEADVVDPLGQSQALYRALKRYGVETELVLYPREGHAFKEEKHLVDRLSRIITWFDKHMK
jgi:dipeptidyl aminopeptidase/acylaminoacyl peptidase